jgi:pyrroline-5-carboxylate reductase
MKIAVIGCGHMGSSMAKKLSQSHAVAVYDKHPEKIVFSQDFSQIKICRDPQEATAHADLILLFVKPRDLENAAVQLRPHLHSHQILLSGLAGTSIAHLKQVFGEKNLILRMMPNLAVEYGQGVVGFVESPNIDRDLKERISIAFADLGLILWLPEDKIDALTALAGSGPAFILIFIEAMIDAGIALGLTSRDARQIALQTIAGTHALMEHTGKHPGELRWQVSSPAGMTIAGTLALEEANVRAGIIKTFLAAYNKAAGLAAQK